MIDPKPFKMAGFRQVFEHPASKRPSQTKRLQPAWVLEGGAICQRVGHKGLEKTHQAISRVVLQLGAILALRACLVEARISQQGHCHAAL